MKNNIYIYIAVMALTTYLIRVLPLTIIRKQIQNRFVKSFLYYVPYVTLAVMTFPAIVNDTQTPISGGLALVLGIIAAKLGAKKVTGIDIDAVAAISARENVKLNRLSKKIDVHYGDASRLQRNSYDLVLANINRNILLQDMDIYANSLHKDGILVMSGFYYTDIPVLAKRAEELGLTQIREENIDNWCSLSFKK